MATYGKNKSRNGQKKQSRLRIFGGDSLEFRDPDNTAEMLNGINYEQINNLCIKILIKDLYIIVKSGSESKFSFVSADNKKNIIDPFTHMLITIYDALERHKNGPHWFFKYFKRRLSPNKIILMFCRMKQV